VTTGFQISVVILVLLAGYNPAFSTLSDIAIYGATVFTILSGAHYIYLGAKMLNERET
jgi:phosphatidylglycerophosphate synthase